MKYVKISVSEELYRRLAEQKGERTWTAFFDGFTKNVVTPPYVLPADLPHCRKRQIIDGTPFCVYKAPFKKDLDEHLNVCLACEASKLPAAAQPIPENIQKPAVETIRNPEIKHEGMTYCTYGGLWVFPEKCSKCRQQSLPTWQDCQREKYKKRGLTVTTVT